MKNVEKILKNVLKTLKSDMNKHVKPFITSM